LSFGGIVAIEIAKHIRPAKIILISSVAHSGQIPFYYHLMGTLKLHACLPATFFKKTSFLVNWFFGVTSSEDKKLLKEILSDTDPVFLKWTIGEIAGWKSDTPTPGVIHIHGDKDRILPIRFTSPDFVIKNGGHLMIWNRPSEVEGILRELLYME